ncbi:hypothetical protein SD81_032305 [Tolypothrix campylonemoides VB511288]|nr:hypothetical protein SD81_032305 [Tolypothrix campylonemoides VB511288]
MVCIDRADLGRGGAGDRGNPTVLFLSRKLQQISFTDGSGNTTSFPPVFKKDWLPERVLALAAFGEHNSKCLP